MTEAGGLIGNFTGEADFLEQKECLAASPRIYGQLVPLLGKYSKFASAGEKAALRQADAAADTEPTPDASPTEATDSDTAATEAPRATLSAKARRCGPLLSCVQQYPRPLDETLRPLPHYHAPFEIHVHGQVPLRPGTRFEQLQALKPLDVCGSTLSGRRCNQRLRRRARHHLRPQKQRTQHVLDCGWRRGLSPKAWTKCAWA